MAFVNARRVAALLVVGLCALAWADSASAATQLGCRASVGRATFTAPFGSAPSFEPVVANAPSTPCANASSDLDQRTFGSPSFGGTVSLSRAGAFTYTTASLPAIADQAPGAASLASTQTVTIKTSNEDIVIGNVQAQAGYACVAGVIAPSSSSSVGSVVVNGSPVTVPVSAPYKVDLTSDGSSYLLLNQTVSAGASLTQQAVVVHIAGPAGSAADFVVAEAKVSGDSGSCAGSTGTPPSLTPCPAGSVYDVAERLCVIPGGGVVPPFRGPEGGKVIGISIARSLYRSPCLSGRGPAYVVVATAPGAHVTGTHGPDRIIALGSHERIAGLGGNDCVDARGAGGTIWEGNGVDRVYGGPGRYRIGLGNGNDYVNGRSGGDFITAGNGRDVVLGGHGSSRIDVGLGADRVFGGPGTNRVYAASWKALISCGSGHHNAAWVKRHAVAYARRHGCEAIHLIG
jgi:hypothetical protein